ncbi:MAG: G8 domain-containing protein [Candidatus Binataceae bacterium]|nr:G8 domain-containing protein [Candidatus Binataceae bacterium]
MGIGGVCFRKEIVGCGRSSILLMAFAAILSLLISASVLRGTTWAATCPSNGNNTLPAGDGGDVEVTGPCNVPAGTYTYRNVNIYAPDPTTCASNPSSCGSLIFADDPAGIDFYAENIIVENGGSLIAGSASAPIGTQCTSGGGAEKCGRVTIHLWGAAADPGALCKSSAQCGVPNGIWTSNTPSMNPSQCSSKTLSNGVNDCFYPYETLDPADGTAAAYFGHKVLAVSYGATLQLFGKKGAVYGNTTTPCDSTSPSCSGTSWARLAGSLKPSATSMTLDRAVDWQDQDHIVVTTTDFLPGHSEELIIQGKPTVSGNTTTINFTNANASITGAQWPHNGKTIDLTNASYSGISRLGLNITQADTRAAVGLLTRSIQIVSQGDAITNPFPAPPAAGSTTPGYYFGGHTMVRQGFQSYQVQGVEFYQLGQGGEIMHYPVHFHMARQVPASTFVKDSSTWDSMTRWIVIHATQGLLLARDVGYKSIGHGYYLEDGTETGNKLYSNLGVLARAAVANAQNPRLVPGILTTKDPSCKDGSLHNPSCRPPDNFPFYSDSNHPTVFWIMNGWNDFEYNFAAGAAACGACYWFVPGAVSGPSRMEKWFGYSNEQLSVIPNKDFATAGYDERAGTTPLQTFVGNTCVSAMNSFQEVGLSAACNGVNLVTKDAKADMLQMLPSDRASSPDNFPQKRATDTYWPIVGGGGRRATRCPAADKGAADADCSASGGVNLCSQGSAQNCDVTVLDRYTTSFNWAQKNFSAIWMRPFWSLVIDSVITDPLAAGLNFVTSGDYSKSAVPDGFWALARKSVFIGSTQWKNSQSDLPNNPYASNAGPFNPFTDGASKGLSCAGDPFSGGANFSYCLNKDAGISMQLETFTNFQRLFSVYDGPAYQDSNAYLNIQPTYLTSDGTAKGTALGGCKPDACPAGATDCNPCANSGVMGDGNLAARADQLKKLCYLPNAAIGWKQSNGFYYSPAFHSTNLYFNGVGIRHFVTEPLFETGLLNFDTNLKAARQEYCRYQGDMFNSFTDIDRETVLNDDDGTLTGLTSPVLAPTPPKTETISVNKETFFNAPSETPECASDLATNAQGDAKCPPNTAKTSPYQYLTTAIYPECGLNPQQEKPFAACLDTDSKQTWGRPCSESPRGSPIQGCAGIPLYRQLLLSTEKEGLDQVKRMMGQGTFQRSGLTVNNGTYYVDTTLSREAQHAAGAKSLNVFTAGQKYDLYFLYANQNTKQTYQMFVGKNLPGCPGQPTFAASNVKFGYVDIATANYKFSTAKPSGSENQNKNVGDLPVGWAANYNCDSGILTLGTDMTSLANDFDLTKDTGGKKPPEPLGKSLCQPATMCSWTSNQCQCNPSSPYYNLCSQKNPAGQNICSWSVKDLDCPSRGCPSFQITFPDAKHFVAEDQKTRPKPSVFGFANAGPAMSFNWDIGFNLESSSISGPECNYTTQPPLQCAASPAKPARGASEIGEN